MEKFFDEFKNPQQKSYLGKGSKLVTCKTDQYSRKLECKNCRSPVSREDMYCPVCGVSNPAKFSLLFQMRNLLRNCKAMVQLFCLLLKDRF